MLSTVLSQRCIWAVALCIRVPLMGVVQKDCSSLSCHKLQTLLDTPGIDWAQLWLKCVIKKFIRNGLVDCLTGELIFITGFGFRFSGCDSFPAIKAFSVLHYVHPKWNIDHFNVNCFTFYKRLYLCKGLLFGRGCSRRNGISQQVSSIWTLGWLWVAGYTWLFKIPCTLMHVYI